MKANNDRSIGDWLHAVKKGALRLPRFQREYVWKPTNTEKLLETIIIKRNIPIGVLLVLETGSASSHRTFKTKNIDGVPDNGKETCREFLLDGQQRLTALWKSLHDKDKNCRYYVKFCPSSYKLELIVKLKKDVQANQTLSTNPGKEFKRKLFPVRLLNPLEDSSVVEEWVINASSDGRAISKVRKMIMDARDNFSQDNGLTLPCFKLSHSTKADMAIDIYRRMNTNSIQLSDYFLAISYMESDGGDSLYDLETKVKSSTGVQDLETDRVGELILKIFCLIKMKKPSGSAYKTLPYEELNTEAQGIIDGIKWTVKKLENLKIWNKTQLPTVVPLRVLPALYVVCNGIRDTDRNNKIINRYLWHAFLTDRYSRQANQRLKEDFDDLREYIDGKKQEDDMEIFNFQPAFGSIAEVGWPQANAKSIMARGILLVCCIGGAKTLKEGVTLGVDDVKERERHHIFPKACGVEYEKLNTALNCMLIPMGENREFSDSLPGDYIQGLIDEVANSGDTLSQLEVVDRLETHCVGRKIAGNLLKIKTGSGMNLESAFDDFIKKRVDVVTDRIKKLTRDGEL